MKRTIFIFLAVALVASVIGVWGVVIQESLERRAVVGEIATSNARWVEWTSRTPGPPTATPPPPTTPTPMTLNCPPPTEEGYRVLCLIVEPAEAEALATAAAAGLPPGATAEAQEPMP